PMALTASPAQSVVPAEAWEMLGRTDLEAYTSWDFPSQAAGHPDAGDASFNGVTPAGCAANLVRRYSGPGDLVVDPMAGSGTIGDVARALGRRAGSFDLVSRRPHILRADARAWPVPAGRCGPRDTLVLVRHHDRSGSPMWEHRARRFNFSLRGFKFLFLLRKPVAE